MSHLTYTIEHDNVAHIVLDNPPQNRIDNQMGQELLEAVNAIEAGAARAVLVRANGDNFSFGGDIVDWPDTPTRELRQQFEEYMFAFNRLEQLPLPVIAAVNGLCFGGGFEMVLRADVIFAGESAAFGHPEQTLGIVTVLGGIYRAAARVGRARAFEWALTSERVPASALAEAGLVNRVVADEDVVSTALEFARKVAAGPTRAHAAHKALLRLWEIGGAAGADAAMFDVAMPLFESKDARKGIPSAVRAYQAGTPRPAVDFSGD